MFSVILATDLHFGIGKNNSIPWHLSCDLKWFKQLTTHNVVVMGRNTWESLPRKPLPNRINIVLSSIPIQSLDPSTLHIRSISELLDLRDRYYAEKEWFIIGGASLYDLFLNSSMINRIYWTLIFETYDCDTKIQTNLFQQFGTSWNWSISPCSISYPHHRKYILSSI